MISETSAEAYEAIKKDLPKKRFEVYAAITGNPGNIDAPPVERP